MLLWLSGMSETVRVGSVTGPLRTGVLNTLKASRRAWKFRPLGEENPLIQRHVPDGTARIADRSRPGTDRCGACSAPRNCHAGFEQVAVPLMAATQPLNHCEKLWLSTSILPMMSTLPGRSTGVPDCMVPMKLYSHPPTSMFQPRPIPSGDGLAAPERKLVNSAEHQPMRTVDGR